jgi:hypothetical protein
MFVCSALLLCASCSGGASRSGQSTSPDPAMDPDPDAPRPADSGARPDQAAPADTVAERTAPAPVSQSECETLFDRFMTIAEKTHAATVAPELQPTPEQVAGIRAQLGPEFVTACVKFDRATYDCAIQAQAEEQIMQCAGTGIP